MTVRNIPSLLGDLAVSAIDLSQSGPGIKQLAAIPALAILLAPLIVPSYTPAQENIPPLKIEQDVSLVTLTATVIDRSGRYVAGLEKSDFRIYEDDVPQKLAVLESEEAPASIGVVFDTSGSMVDKIDDVQDAVKHFVDLVNPSDDIFLIRFSSDVQLVADFTNDRKRLSRAVDRLRPRGATLLYDATAQALEKIQRGRHKKKALLLVTDGNDTASQMELGDLLFLARKSEVLIYAFGIGHGKTGSFGHLPFAFKDEVDMRTLDALAESSGARSYFLEQAHSGKVDRIDMAVKEVAAELRQQYGLAYYPSNSTRDGGYRRIRVETVNPNYVVRTRNGYYATLAKPDTPGERGR
jgi:Ca-activated chloride channel family protein